MVTKMDTFQQVECHEVMLVYMCEIDDMSFCSIQDKNWERNFQFELNKI